MHSVDEALQFLIAAPGLSFCWMLVMQFTGDAVG